MFLSFFFLERPVYMHLEPLFPNDGNHRNWITMWLVKDEPPINTTCICNNLRRNYAPMTLYLVQFMNIPSKSVISFHNCHTTLL